MLQEVKLEDMLLARERRAFRQQKLIKVCGLPIISFTLNIPGPIKDSPLIRRSYTCGRKILLSALATAGFTVVQKSEELSFTGCELMLAVEAKAQALKEICVSIEERHPLGRLFDMDVIAPDGLKLDRELPRCCIICGAEGRYCASRRAHSVEELQNAVRELMLGYFLTEDSELISELITKALIDEVKTTPKPGLVDLDNNGSHEDMSVSTFIASAEALRPHWAKCFEIGVKGAKLPAEKIFESLRSEGLLAEADMYKATCGINTHKGAVFMFSCICGALGRLWDGCGLYRAERQIFDECRLISRAAVEADFVAIRKKNSPASVGENLYLSYGFTGIRGEVASGMPGVHETSLPVYKKALAAGYSQNDAGAIALIHLIARGTDTNMVARGGIMLASEAAKSAENLLNQTPFPSMDEIRAMDEQFVEQNLSPGGCADLLAVTYFTTYLKSLKGEQEEINEESTIYRNRSARREPVSGGHPSGL